MRFAAIVSCGRQPPCCGVSLQAVQLSHEDEVGAPEATGGCSVAEEVLLMQMVQAMEDPMQRQDQLEEPAAEDEAFTDAFEEEDEDDDGMRHRRLLLFKRL